MTSLIGGTYGIMPNFGTSTPDESFHVYSHRRDFSHRRRGESEFGARGRFWTLWTRPQQMGAGIEGYDGGTGEDASRCTAKWGPWQQAARGVNNIKFILGRTVDASNVALTGVAVQAFLTANDQFVRETTSDSNGYYELGTEYSGASHYLVAYMPGSPDKTGSTVNTLTPTNRDGT